LNCDIECLGVWVASHDFYCDIAVQLSYNQLLLDRAGYVFKGGNAEFNYPVTDKKKVTVGCTPRRTCAPLNML